MARTTDTMHAALKAAVVALNDWVCTFAPEFCSEENVKEAQDRLAEHGTLHYIATVTEQCVRALAENESTVLKVNDRVTFVNTGDDRLDGAECVVSGFYGPESVIVSIVPIIDGYNPSIVISRNCLKKG